MLEQKGRWGCNESEPADGGERGFFEPVVEKNHSCFGQFNWMESLVVDFS